MNASKIKPGDKAKVVKGLSHWVFFPEPMGDLDSTNPMVVDKLSRLGHTSGLPVGDTVLAGSTAVFVFPIGSRDSIQWFKHAQGWFYLLTANANQFLTVAAEYGPMGALVIDDMSGDDICADV